MNDMRLIETSLHIALRAYAGKVDKAGREYILHPLRVMAKMRSELEMSAALLHDVLEDSEITAEELLAEGIPAEVVEADATAAEFQDVTERQGKAYREWQAAQGKEDALKRERAGVYLATMIAQVDILIENDHPLSEVANESVIEAVDGHEVYFQRSSVLNDVFDRMTIGSAVRSLK